MTHLPRPLSVLTSATLADGRVVDVVLDAEDVAAVLPAGGADPVALGAAPEAVLDLSGHVLLVAGADPHAHLDKALSWESIRPPMGDLRLAIESWRAFVSSTTTEEIAQRARTQALRMLANGTTAVRSHADVLPGDDPLRSIRAVVEVRDELADLIDIEVVALAGHDIPSADIEAALDAGADTVGGAPHLAPDPLHDLHRILDIAEARGLDVDLHTDEGLDGTVTLDAYAERTKEWPQRRSAGHCVRLSTLPEPQRDDVIEQVRASGIGIIANPITNLYLQGWEGDVAMPRGIAPARQLLDAGVAFAAGADNVRDPFNPLGRSDVFETAMLLVAASHLTIDEAYGAVSTGARGVMGLPIAGIEPGARAEFLAVRAASLPDAVANAPADRYVIHRGRLVAESRTERAIAQPSSSLNTASPLSTRKVSA